MNRFRNRLILACILLFNGANATYEDPGVIVVKQIEVLPGKEDAEGAVDNSAVLTRLRTRVGEPFTQRDFDQDLKTLSKEYHRVEPDLDISDDQAHIRLRVWPKPIIRSIIWAGNEELDEKALNKELGIKEGSVFDRQGFNSAFHQVQAYYIKKGYFETELDYQVIADPVTNEVDVEVSIHEGRSGRIEKLDFVGFTSKEQGDLANMMLTKEYFFLTSWVTGTGTYQPDMVEQDKVIIVNYLHNQGYADARVNIEVVDSPKSNRIILRISAEKGDVYRIGKLSFAGNELFSDEEVEKQLFLKSGDVYSPDRIRELADAIQMLYGRKGYIDALVVYQPTLRENDDIYDLHLQIEEGEQYRVGMIKVIGNRWTRRQVILHETLLVPGEVFNLQKLRLTEQRLFNMDYFETVNVYPVRSAPLEGMEGNYRDVIIEVEEKGTGNFGFSAGFSSNESVFLGLTLQEKNFNIAGLASMFGDGISTLRGGGEFLSARANIGQRSHLFAVSWTKPYIFDSNWIFGVDLEYSHSSTYAKDYEVSAKAMTVHAQYPINQFLRLGTHYRLRDSQVDVDRKSRRDLFGNGDEEELEEGQSIDDLVDRHELNRQERNAGLVSAVGASLTYDSTDHPIHPHSGFRSYLGSEYAGLGGDYDFVKLEYLNSYYVPICSDGTLKLRGDLQFIGPVSDTTSDDIPIIERFFLGGENAMRGYRPGAVGPQFNRTNDPRGGVTATLVSAEYAHYIHPRVEPFVFVDAGDVTKSSWSPRITQVTTGIGARVALLPNLPPITVGYGWPLTEKDDSKVKNLFFAMGGNF